MVQSSKTRLAIIDLDGTLLGPDKRVGRANREALRSLRSAGFEIIIASGRHHQNILGLAEHTGPLGWIISSQGAVVRHAGINEQLHEFTVPEADALALYDTGRKAGLSVLVYHRDGVFMEEESEWTRLYATRAGWTPQKADLARLAASGVQKVILSAAPATMAQLGPELDRVFGERLYVVAVDDEATEFLSPRANKALAAETLVHKLAVERADTVAFGDGNNDAELLSWAGFSVAMAHGRAAALQAASIVSRFGPPESAFARAVAAVLGRE